MIAADEAPHIIGWNTKNGWYPRGRPVTTSVSLSRKRSCSLGALRAGGSGCRSCEKANRHAFIDMPGHLRHKHGRIIVFPGNAAYHKSAGVRKFVDACGGDIILEYLPEYTPELNPAEGQWRLLRKATANVLYEGTREMMDSMWAMLGGGEVRTAKLNTYLS